MRLIEDFLVITGEKNLIVFSADSHFIPAWSADIMKPNLSKTVLYTLDQERVLLLTESGCEIRDLSSGDVLKEISTVSEIFHGVSIIGNRMLYLTKEGYLVKQLI